MTLPFADIAAVAVEIDRKSDGPDDLALVLRLRGRPGRVVLHSRCQEERAALEAFATRLRQAL